MVDTKLLNEIVAHVVESVKQKRDEKFFLGSRDNLQGLQEIDWKRLIMEKDQIDESLIQSYPPVSVKRLLHNKFGLNDEQVIILNNGEQSHLIAIAIPTSAPAYSVGKVKELMNWCGYFINKKTQRVIEGYRIYVFEPKFGNDISKHVRRNYQYLFHVAPKKYLNRILKSGLIPKSKNSLFLYPDRVHLMLGDSLTDQQKEELDNVNRIRKVDYSNPKDSGENVLLTIATSRIPSHVRLYSDQTASGAIFTHDNLPPDSIVKIEDFKD